MRYQSSERGAALLDYVAIVALMAVVATAGISATGHETMCALGAGDAGLGVTEFGDPVVGVEVHSEFMIDECDVPCALRKGPVNGYYKCVNP